MVKYEKKNLSKFTSDNLRDSMTVKLTENRAMKLSFIFEFLQLVPFNFSLI